MTRHALREVTQRQMINIVAARRRKGQDEETGDDESKYKYKGNQTALVKSSLSSEQKKETHCNSKVFCNLDECLIQSFVSKEF